MHAARLVGALRKRAPESTFCAVGGENLKEAGADILENSSGWSGIGVFDSIGKVPGIYLAYRRLRKKLKKIRPDGAILIDTAAFNSRVARFLHSIGVPVIYFFPPSSWKKDSRRAAAVGQWLTKVIAPFEETAELYRKAGVPTFFSGHPLLDQVADQKTKAEICSGLGLDPQKPIVGLFPGSRRQEIRYLLPLELEVASRLSKKFPGMQFALPIASRVLEPQIAAAVEKSGIRVTARRGINRDVMAAGDAFLLASGTATLEAALREKPMVIIYKVSRLSWALQKPFVRVRFAGLPNLLADAPIVPELLQDSATADNIAAEMEKLFEPERRKKMTADLRAIRAGLGEAGVMDRVADEILETFRG